MRLLTSGAYDLLHCMTRHDELSLGSVDAADLVREMQSVDLGDARRSARFLKLLQQMAENPSASFASMCQSEAELEALYRLLRNDAVEWQGILQPHIDSTCERAKACGDVLAVHDTSTFRVAANAQLDSYVQTGKPGFFAHVSLIVDQSDFRRPLGVGAVEIIQRRKGQKRTQKNGRPMSGAETAKLEGREFERWWRAVEEVERRLSDANVVHVMDREADSYELLAKLHNAGAKYVIRCCKDRRARASGNELFEWSKVRELLEQARHTRLKREVQLSPRKAKTAPGANKASPARRGRSASLRIAHQQIEVKAPRYLLNTEHPPSLTLSLVRVYEPEPPSGETPIEWVLLTNLPASRAAEVERVVDIYRQRWLIEELFKALKTGCGYRTRKLVNAQSILNSFATLLPIAFKALAVRHLAQDAQAPASLVLDEAELAVVKAKASATRLPISKDPTASEVLAIVARLGGHRKSSGAPGWLTLLRGSEKIQNMAEGWRLARAEM